MDKAEELKKSSLQKDVPEAVASVSYTAITPNGYSVIVTMRDRKESDLFERMEAIEQYFDDAGYSPNGKSVLKSNTGAPKGNEKPVQMSLDGKTCPKCGAPLEEIEAKGKKALRCSTNTWDPATKTASGCDFFTYIEPATEAQEKLLKEKNLWEEGMLKGEATEIIGRIFGK